MNEENKITKRSDLFREYARVMDMVEGTNVSPNQCIKDKGKIGVINLNIDYFNDYDFALAIVEDRPVFKGDVLWTKDLQQITAESSNNDIKIWASDGRLFTCDFLSWQEIKRIITINGKEYNAPVPQQSLSCYAFHLGEELVYFHTREDMLSVFKALRELLNGK